MQNSDDPHVVFPSSLDDLIKAIQKAQKEHGPKLMYRGQMDVSWEINSSFSRGFTKETLQTIRAPLTRGEVKSYGIALMSFLNYFLSMKPSEEVIQNLNGKGCPYFEVTRHHQQNSLKSKIHGIQDLNIPGSPIVDFTFDALIALFFANFEIDYKTEGLQPHLLDIRSTDAAIYVVNYEAFKIYTSFKEILLDYKLSDTENRGFKAPCIISLLHQLNDKNDMKPKRQQAFYVVHIDSRYSLDSSLSIIEASMSKKMYSKIVVPKSLFEECREFLFGRNYTLDHLFPPEIQYQAERIKNVHEQWNQLKLQPEQRVS
jgi:hypothetical protein